MFMTRYLTYRARIVIWIFTDSSQFILFPFLWAAVFAGSSLPLGYNLQSLVTYYIILAVVSGGFISHCSRHVRNEIMDGTMARRLSVPLPYFWFIVMAEISYKYISGIISAITIIILYFAGSSWFIFPHSMVQWGMFVFSIIFTFLISHFFQYLIGLATFWLGDIKSLQTTQEVIEAIFSGRLAPLVFFAAPIQTLAEYLPFKYLANVPAEIYIGKIPPSEFWPTFLPGIGWVIALSLITVIMWRQGLGRHEGFGM